MKILEKIMIDDIEYVCIQAFLIDNEMIYKICNLNGENCTFVKEKQNLYEVIYDKAILEKIKKLTEPKTDIITMIKE